MEKTQINKNTQTLGNTKQRFRKACFTLNNWTTEELDQMLRDFDGMKYIIGKEVGEQGTPHLQGYVEFGRQLSFNQLKKISDRAHWEKPRGNKKQNIKYCSKDGNFVSTFPVPVRERILNSYSNTQWRPWQQDILNLIESEPDDRTINWFWESEGSIGKSYLAKYLVLKYDAIICSGKSADIFNQVNVWLGEHEGLSPKLIICDIPRTSLNYVCYNALEQLKNGMLYSGKYEGGVCIFDSPHVVCFANEEPYRPSMSKDRWNIVRIN